LQLEALTAPVDVIVEDDVQQPTLDVGSAAVVRRPTANYARFLFLLLAAFFLAFGIDCFRDLISTVERSKRALA